MKKLYTILAVLLMTATTFAQTPEKMSYQAVVRDGSDALVSSQVVGMQISILQTTASGTAVYVETHTPTTNLNGLVTLEIGTGAVVSGDFATIDWPADSYFIKTETDPTGGSSYTITGTSQLLSVPYALHAKTADNTFSGDYNDLTNTLWNATGSNIFNNNAGNVGIGTSTPSEKLRVEGLVSSSQGYHILNGTFGLNIQSSRLAMYTGNNYFAVGLSDFLWRYNSSNKMHLSGTTGNLGIGIVGATHRLEVVGTTLLNGQVTITDGSEAAGKALTSDASGNATWADVATELPTNAYTGDMSYWNGSAWVVIVATSNEGATLQMIGGVPTWTGGTPPPPATVGDLRNGGVVFWVDPADNTHGLVCALSDSSSLEEWGCFGTDLPNVPNVAYNGANPVGLGAEIGDGISNTNNILNDCSTAPAALAARSLGNEWFLPSIHELNEMYVNRAILESVPGFVVFQNHYWSSTEITNDYAWRLRFQTGSLYSTTKNATFNYVRAVRAF